MAGTGLVLHDVHVSYAGKPALQGLNLTVAPGEILGFVGPNGAGKTTTMRTVLGIVTLHQGAVLWRGQRVDSSVRRRFGYMPEERGLYPKMRVREQLGYLATLRGLGAADATALADTWTQRLGVHGQRLERVEALSLGNQQRVQLAAALLHSPDLLVLDEPFSGLDPVGVETMSRVLHEEAGRGAAVLFSSHQLDLVEALCDSVAVVNRGRIVASGRVVSLRAQSRRRLEVKVDDVGTEWIFQVPGVRSISRLVPAGDSPVVIEIEDNVDDQQILKAAQAAGRVSHFKWTTPTLSDVFNAAVKRP